MAGFTQLAAIAYEHTVSQGLHDKWSSGGLATGLGTFSGDSGLPDSGDMDNIDTGIDWADLANGLGAGGLKIDITATVGDTANTRVFCGTSVASLADALVLNTGATQIAFKMGGNSVGVTRCDWNVTGLITPGTEQRFRLVWSGLTTADQFQLFIDETEVLPREEMSTPNPGSEVFRVGRGRSTGNEFFKGTMRRFQITVAEVELADYRFVETTGTTVEDFSGSANNGTLKVDDAAPSAPQIAAFWTEN